MVGKVLSEKVIRKKVLPKMIIEKKFPILRFEFIDLNPVVKKHRKHIDMMKLLFGQNDQEPRIIQPGDNLHSDIADEHLENVVIEIQPYLKYTQDIYYIAPFYHVTFPGIEKLIALDLDLQFRYDDH